MGTTPGGLPYPDGADKVVDGDDAIKALAQAVDGKLGGHGFKMMRGFVTTNPAGNAAWNAGVVPLAYWVTVESGFAVTTSGESIAGTWVGWFYRNLANGGAALPNDGAVFNVLVMY
jgi:hypothetical protein